MIHVTYQYLQRQRDYVFEDCKFQTLQILRRPWQRNYGNLQLPFALGNDTTAIYNCHKKNNLPFFAL